MSTQNTQFIIQMKASERYEQMIVQTQIKYAPMTRTDAMKRLMEEGAKTLLKGVTLPKEAK